MAFLGATVLTSLPQDAVLKAFLSGCEVLVMCVHVDDASSM